MVNQSLFNVEVEIIESDEGGHRYYTKKVWDKDRPLLAILTLYPSFTTFLETDLTSQLIQNNVSKLGYGGFISINLFSVKYTGKREFAYETDKINDSCIVKSAREAEYIVMAYGNRPAKNKKVQKRVDEVMLLLKNEHLSNKIRTLTDEKKAVCIHPLSSKIRKNWVII